MLGHEGPDAERALHEQPGERDNRVLVRREDDRAVLDRNRKNAGRRPADRGGRRIVRRPEAVGGRRGRVEVCEGALVDDPARADDRDPVAELLDLRQEVAREEDRHTLVREISDQ